MMMKKIVLVALLAWIVFPAFAQTHNDDKDDNKGNSKIAATSDVLAMVKQYDEFVKRFNVDDRYMAKLTQKLGATIDWHETRYKFIAGMMNVDNPLENAEILKFVRMVQDKNHKINQAAPDAYADATVVFHRNGKPQEWTLRLIMEGNNDKGWKWVMTDAQSPTIKYHHKSDTIRISPMDNEVDFIGLNEVLGSDYRAYTPQGYTPDNLSVFLYLTGTQQLVYQKTKTIVYHQKLGGYSFFVQETYLKDSPRKGYLITGLIDPEGKKIF